jgi:small subunit ribosomal protein S17
VATQIKTKTGRVVSDKMEKTIVVEVVALVEHRLYKKRLRQTHKFQAHDEENQAHTGDLVKIAETRPISKNKTWKLLEVVRSSNAVTAEELATAGELPE